MVINCMAMCEALRKWENIIRDFTYQSLLEILIGRREGALADQVCRTFIQSQASELNKEEAVSLSPAPGTTTADLIKEFDRRRFRDLRKIALEEITEKRIPVTEFR
ncbi:uncharacterized protein LOC135343986 [Halichondria panicea]|uniref:uncharacterized protein LOC135343986 n=1 Tax=Halichondria panicea TaxID=6063 RepID=UPI00312BBC94